ncbi:MAG: hypothetical protein LBJ61_06820, partial [Deltaproteobacteria bacterium]|nr:hypothetical protein [Deltaproteobacteria bacterium]
GLLLSVFGALVVALASVVALGCFPPIFWLTMVKIQTLIPLLCLTYMGMGLHRRKMGHYALATVILLIMFSLLS